MKTKYKIALAMLAGTRPPTNEVRVMRLPRLTPRSTLASVTLALAAASSLAAPASAQLMDRKDLSYAMALTIATGALEACKARGYPTGGVVVDRGGNTIVSLKGDNAGLHTVENARRKAYTALTFLSLIHISEPTRLGM